MSHRTLAFIPRPIWCLFFCLMAWAQAVQGMALAPSAPASPTGLSSVAGIEQVSLTWNAVSGATSYNVYQGLSPGNEAATPVLTGITAATATVSGLTGGVRYYFKVRAVNDVGTSGDSNETNAVALARPAGGSGSGGTGGSTGNTQTNVTVTIDNSASGSAKRLLLGSNAVWYDNGDGMIQPNTVSFDPAKLAAVQRMAPTLLRYPGGTFSDTYRWKAGVGPLSARTESPSPFSRGPQKVLFGTDEFLALCQLTGAEAMITVNVVTASSSEAVDWVNYVNKTVRNGPLGPLPKVTYWEIGNEPYLKVDGRSDLDLTPAQFVARANEFIAAMKAADPSIKVLLPARYPTLGSVVATRYPDYLPVVFGGLTQAVDMLALHDAYLPLVIDNSNPSQESLFKAAMAAAVVTKQDFMNVRAEWVRIRGTAPPPLAITEFAPLFTTGNLFTDGYITSLAGGLVNANSYSLFDADPEVKLANQYALSQEGSFGAVGFDSTLRPAGVVHSAFSSAMKGTRLGVTVQGPTFSNAAVGAVPAQSATPEVSVLAHQDGKLLRVLLTNRSYASARIASVTRAGGGGIVSASARVLTTSDAFAGANDASPRPDFTPLVVPGTAFPLSVTLPAHSLVELTVTLP